MNNSTFFHLACYYGSVANATANVDIPLVNDSILTKANNHAILPSDGSLLAAVAISANADRVRLNTPSARYVGLPSIVPVNTGTTVPSPPNIYDMTEFPLLIPQADEIAMEGTQSGGAAENMAVGVFFGFGNRGLPSGQRYRVRGTSSITAVAGSWVNGSITMDTVLPRGIYAVTGLDVVGTNLFLARLVVPGSSYRPGTLCRNAAGSIRNNMFSNGSLGLFCEFDSVNVPNLDILSLGANSSQVIYMDVVKIR